MASDPNDISAMRAAAAAARASYIAPSTPSSPSLSQQQRTAASDARSEYIAPAEKLIVVNAPPPQVAESASIRPQSISTPTSVVIAGSGARASAQDVIDVVRIADQLPAGMAIGRVTKQDGMYKIESLGLVQHEQAVQVRSTMTPSQRRVLSASTFLSPYSQQYAGSFIAPVIDRITGTKSSTPEEIEIAHLEGMAGLNQGKSFLKGAVGGIQSLPGKIETAALGGAVIGAAAPVISSVVPKLAVDIAGAGLLGVYAGSKAAEFRSAWLSKDMSQVVGVGLGTAAEIGGAYAGASAVAKELAPRSMIAEQGSIVVDKQEGIQTTGTQATRSSVRTGGDVAEYRSIGKFRTGISSNVESSGDVNKIFGQTADDISLGLGKSVKLRAGAAGEPSSFIGESMTITEQPGVIGTVKRSLGESLGQPKWGYDTATAGAKVRVMKIGNDELRAAGIVATGSGGSGVYAGRFKVINVPSAGSGGSMMAGSGGTTASMDTSIGDIVSKLAAEAGTKIQPPKPSIVGIEAGSAGSLITRVQQSHQPISVDIGEMMVVSPSQEISTPFIMRLQSKMSPVYVPSPPAPPAPPEPPKGGNVVTGGYENLFSDVGKLQPEHKPIVEPVTPSTVPSPRVVRLSSFERSVYGGMTKYEMKEEKSRKLKVEKLSEMAYGSEFKQMQKQKMKQKETALLEAVNVPTMFHLGNEAEQDKRVRTGYDSFITQQFDMAQSQGQKTRTVYGLGLRSVLRMQPVTVNPPTPVNRMPVERPQGGGMFGLDDIVTTDSTQRRGRGGSPYYEEKRHPGSILRAIGIREKPERKSGGRDWDLIV